jgi:hypothetical protein
MIEKLGEAGDHKVGGAAGRSVGTAGAVDADDGSEAGSSRRRNAGRCWPDRRPRLIAIRRGR